MIDLTRHGWGKDNPTFRQIFTSRFIPGGTEEQLRWFNDLCRKTTTGEIAARLFEARAMVDATAILDQVRAPTLIVHARDDEITPISEGRLVAAGLPGAEFVELDSRNHILLEQEPAWDRFRQAVLDFLHVKSAEGEDAAFGALSTRESVCESLGSDWFGRVIIASRPRSSLGARQTNRCPTRMFRSRPRRR